MILSCRGRRLCLSGIGIAILVRAGFLLLVPVPDRREMDDFRYWSFVGGVNFDDGILWIQSCRSTGSLRRAEREGRDICDRRLAWLIADRMMKWTDIDNESDQAQEGHSVDALASRGDEGRGTLR